MDHPERRERLISRAIVRRLAPCDGIEWRRRMTQRERERRPFYTLHSSRLKELSRF
jgi:hypothetical protein